MMQMGNVADVRREMTKTKEQLEEEKKISLSIRIHPLELDGIIFPLSCWAIENMTIIKVWTLTLLRRKERSCGS